MSDTTLAETLRAFEEFGRMYHDNLMSVPEAYRHNAGRRADYLRGYDDAKAEIDTLTARVRELEAQLAIAESQRDTAQEQIVDLLAPMAGTQQPAAVGVVGAVSYMVMDNEGNDTMHVNPYTTRERAENFLTSLRHPEYCRIVAIVDPDAIVPLASGEPFVWRNDVVDGVCATRLIAAHRNALTVTPLYPGLAQPAQEEA